MNKRTRSTKFTLQELYSFADLEAYSNGSISRSRIRGLVIRSGCPLVRSGRTCFITIGNFRRYLPDLFDAFMEKVQLIEDYT